MKYKNVSNDTSPNENNMTNVLSISSLNVFFLKKVGKAGRAQWTAISIKNKTEIFATQHSTQGYQSADSQRTCPVSALRMVISLLIIKCAHMYTSE